MKIPTSSSILLATLAISSSSSCLAAPSGDLSHDHGMTASHSHARVSSVHEDGAANDVHPSDIHMQQRSEDIPENITYLSNIEARDPTVALYQIIDSLPILGPTLGKVLEKLLPGGSASAKSVDGGNGDSSQDVDPQDLEALQSAAQEVSRVLNQTFANAPSPVQGAVGQIASNLPGPAGALSEGDDQSIGPTSSGYLSSASADPTQTAAAQADASSTATYSSASAAPSSPPMPGNPPNTPAIPVNPPINLPVNA